MTRWLEAMKWHPDRQPADKREEVHDKALISAPQSVGPWMCCFSKLIRIFRILRLLVRPASSSNRVGSRRRSALARWRTPTRPCRTPASGRATTSAAPQRRQEAVRVHPTAFLAGYGSTNGFQGTYNQALGLRSCVSEGLQLFSQLFSAHRRCNQAVGGFESPKDIEILKI